jgi:hypothetical protein
MGHCVQTPTSRMLLQHQIITNMAAVTRDLRCGKKSLLIFDSIAPHDPTAPVIHGKAVQYDIFSGFCMSDDCPSPVTVEHHCIQRLQAWPVAVAICEGCNRII